MFSLMRQDHSSHPPVLPLAVAVVTAHSRAEGEVDRALTRLGEAVAQVMAETGLSEDDLARLFDLRREPPE